jgi:hypothetical protein
MSTGEHTGTGPASAGPDPCCACLWCGKAFRPRGATGKRFCSDRCRAAFHRGCRLWAMRAVEGGRLSLQAVQDASRNPYTGVPGASAPSGGAGEPDDR